MGNRGRELIGRDCSPDAFCEQIEAVYAKLLPARESAIRTSAAEFAD